MTGKVSRNSNGRLEKQMANNSVTKSAIQLNSTQLDSTASWNEASSDRNSGGNIQLKIQS